MNTLHYDTLRYYGWTFIGELRMRPQEVVLWAVQTSGTCLRFACDELRKDPDLCLEAGKRRKRWTSMEQKKINKYQTDDFFHSDCLSFRQWDRTGKPSSISARTLPIFHNPKSSVTPVKLQSFYQSRLQLVFQYWVLWEALQKSPKSGGDQEMRLWVN